jgi:hypothetical protein
MALCLLVLLAACGGPVAEAPPTAVALPSATSSPAPVATPPAAPTLTVAPTLTPTFAPPAQPAASPQPASALQYLLPPDFNAGYAVDPQSVVVDAAQFSLRMTPLGLEPGPETTIRLTGGVPAEEVWRENQPGGFGSVIEAVPVRGGPGTLASSGFGATVAWRAAEVPYFANLTGTRPAPMLAWVEDLVAYDQGTWTALVRAAAPGELPALRYFLPADFPEAYPDQRWEAGTPIERGYTLRLYPDGPAEDPSGSATITLLAGAPAAPLVAQAFAEPGALIAEPLTIRDQPGRLAVLPGSLLLAWVEDATPYALVFEGIGEDVPAWQALAAGFVEVEQAEWSARVGEAR